VPFDDRTSSMNSSRTRQAPALLLASLALLGVVALLTSVSSATANPIQSKRAQAQAVLAQIHESDIQLEKAIESYNYANVQLDQIDADLASAQQQLADTRARLAQDKKELASQLVVIYKQGETSTINRVLGSSSFNSFWQQLIDLRRLAGSQQDTLKAVQDAETQVTRLVADVTAKQAQQKQALADLRTQADGLQVQLSARQATVAELQQVQAQDAAQLALAEQSAKELDQQIAAIKEAMAEAARRGGGNGHFVWPEQGPITPGFGCTPYQFENYDPDCPSKHFHTGIDIGDAWGTPVGAGDAGIAYTYYSSYGYGNHVIIVHGNGWVSVYGHLASFAVGNGQAVGRGQTIGYEGSTGNSTGPHLHFEVRYNDNPVNPLNYLP